MNDPNAIENDERIHVLSFGGGLNSSAMLVWLVDNNYPLDLVIFADTLDESPETYAAVDYFEAWCKERDIEFVQVARMELGPNEGLKAYCVEKQIIPSRIRRDCTDKFKIIPIRRHLRSTYPKTQRFRLYIGITIDEAHRIRDSDKKYIDNDYPFVWAKIDRDGCTDILETAGHPTPPKSGCWYCPFQSKAKWIKMMKEDPAQYEEAIAFEENGMNFPTVTLWTTVPLRVLRDRIQNQTTLSEFDPGPDPEITCDVAGGCFN